MLHPNDKLLINITLIPCYSNESNSSLFYYSLFNSCSRISYDFDSMLLYEVKSQKSSDSIPLLFVIQLFVMVFCTSCILKFYSSSFILIQETIHPTYEITLSILSFAIQLPHHSSLCVMYDFFKSSISYIACNLYPIQSFFFYNSNNVIECDC